MPSVEASRIPTKAYSPEWVEGAFSEVRYSLATPNLR
jgi:hypothetical protein